MKSCHVHPLAPHNFDRNRSQDPTYHCDCDDFSPWEDDEGLSHFDALVGCDLALAISGALTHIDYLTGQLPDKNKSHSDGCVDHPLAEHGFNREASMAEDEYVCDCRGFTFEDSQAGITLSQLSSLPLNKVLHSVNVHVEHLESVVDAQQNEIIALKQQLAQLQQRNKV